MQTHTIELTDRQAAMLQAEAERLGLTLDELVRRVLDAWAEEREMRPYLCPPFRFVPVDPGTGAPPPPCPWSPPVTVYSIGEPVMAYAVGIDPDHWPSKTVTLAAGCTGTWPDDEGDD